MSSALDRTTHPGSPGPRDRRILHLGLGAFHRSHQAWYTARAADGARWGITAYSGRRPDTAVALQAQDGLYTLIERNDTDDRAEIIDVITEAVDGSDVDHFTRAMADAATALVTLTITEAGYQPAGDGEVSAGVINRLAVGLDARRRAGAGPLALVSCDNLPDNGEMLRRALAPHLVALGPDVVKWVDSEVSFVSTSVDRITPRTTRADLAAAETLTGYRDACPVVTEPFSDWILQGAFPAGRPAWESAGARFVDDLEPFERRKLWLLNGAHTLLAATGRLRGHDFVDQAFGDPVLRAWVEDLWDAAARHLPSAPDLGLDAYRAALARRFANSTMRHALDQIDQEVVTKLRVRVLPVLLAEVRAGEDGLAAARPIAAHLLTASRSLDTSLSGLDVDPEIAERVRESVERAMNDLRPALDAPTRAAASLR